MLLATESIFDLMFDMRDTALFLDSLVSMCLLLFTLFADSGMHVFTKRLARFDCVYVPGNEV